MSRQNEAKNFLKAWAEYALHLSGSVIEAEKDLVGNPAVHQQVGWIGQQALSTSSQRLDVAKLLALAEFARVTGKTEAA